MSADHKDIPDNIRQRFPNLKPLGGVPSLFTLNGFGLGMYGRRDFDAETQTYIKTRCICALFIPLFALGAYRVADAGSRSWFFFGRESLSHFARSCNIAIGIAFVFLGLAGGWGIYTSSPQYKAQQEIKQAAADLKAGDAIKAAGTYRRQLAGPAAPAARQGLKESLEAALQSEQPKKSRPRCASLPRFPPASTDPCR